MEKERLFVALALPAVVQAELANLNEPLDGVRWIPAGNLHLTLRFLGATDAARRAAIEAALINVRVEPFVLPVCGVGLFPSRGAAKVLWVGVGRAHTRLFQLRKQVDDALLSVDPAIDVRSFQPHITIARLGESLDPKLLARFLEKHEAFEAPPFRVSSFQLFASESVSGSALRYRVLREFALEK